MTCVLIASMWGCRFSVLWGDTCFEISFRHILPMDESDFNLLFNQNLVKDKYNEFLKDDKNEWHNITVTKK